MSDLLEVFNNKKTSKDALIKFGFVEKTDNFLYSKNILDNQFRLNVIVKNSAVDYKVIDLGTNEEYILTKLPNVTGAFVGKIKTEIENIFASICNKCFEKDIFKSELASRIIEYVKTKYGGKLEYLWEKFPNNAIWRNPKNNKWFGALLIVEKSKLGFNSKEKIEIIDLKAKPDEIKTLVDGKTIFEGYHMNKKHWVTIMLDGSVSFEKICDLIDKSYLENLKK